MTWSQYDEENEANATQATTADSGELGFDVGAVEVTPTYDLIPPGRYRVACTGAKVAPSKNNPSTTLAQIEETIVDEDSPLRGRKIWSRYVVAHADGKVMARGRQDVARLMSAYGVGGTNLSPCVGRECIASVDIQPAKGEWEAANRVKRRELTGGQAPVGASTSSTPAPAKAKASAPSFLSKRKQAEQQ